MQRIASVPKCVSRLARARACALAFTDSLRLKRLSTPQRLFVPEPKFWMGDFDHQDEDEDRPRKGRRQEKQRMHDAFSARFEETFGKDYDYESRKKRKLEEEMLAEEQKAGALPANPLLQERYTYGDVYKYKHVKNLGAGTFSNVFLGEDRDRNQFVLKKLKMTTTIDLEVYEREIDSLKACDHPNVLKLIEVCENVKGQKFIVLEYAGHNLRQIIGGKPLSQRECKHLFSQLLQGIERMLASHFCSISHLDIHSKDIIHRDLKTDNLMVNKKGILKIGDFGSSRKWERMAKLTPEVSSLRYRYDFSCVYLFPDCRAPEILLCSEKYDKAADMWSVGCIFAEMLLGRYFRLFSILVSHSIDNCLKALLSENKLKKCVSYWARFENAGDLNMPSYRYV